MTLNSPQYEVKIGLTTCGIAAGSAKTYLALQEALQSASIEDIQPQRTGCIGMCYNEPLVEVVSPEGESYLYGKVSPEDARHIVAEHIVKGIPLDDLLVLSPDKETPAKQFLDKQEHLLLKNFGIIDPESIDSYIKTGGYEALKKVLIGEGGISPEDVIKEIKISGLRGRGGAGFPTGEKWYSAQKNAKTPKYVICNGDEGDPGAFMDRSVLEGNPHAVLEGMTIAAYAIGANYGYIYVRAEYPLAVKRLKIAIEQAKQRNFLGPRIMGRDFRLDIKIFQGAGAFVCGESTALVRSIEGFRGVPKPLPRPRTTEEGLRGRPTLLNNVKTFAYVPEIIIKGGEWFSRIGTKESTGTAVFALAGKIKNNGLIEVPMGITLKEIIFDVGGGIDGDLRFKAVQIGGPSGGCLPEQLLDLHVDFDSLLDAGAMMGSGGMVVLDETSCMVDVARYFLEFTVNESCGQCVPCREGTQQMSKILEEIVSGKGRLEDLPLLEEIGKAIIMSSICGLGKSAPNPVLSTLRYFRDEYEAHIRDNSCPALYCKELIAYWIDPDKCKGCGLCLKECSSRAISGEKKMPHVIDQTKCLKCAICLETCPDKFSAVRRVTGRTRLDLIEAKGG